LTLAVDAGAVARAAEVLRRGGVVCYPTETYYGLGVDALDGGAVARLLAVKGRGADQAIAVIVPDLAAARRLWAEVPPRLEALARAHWPGPLTLVAPAAPGVPAPLRGPGGGVGARVSSHPWAHALARAFGGPLTATSANRAGAAPVTSCAAARAALGAEVDLYLDAGATPGGLPSTVVAVAPDGALAVLRAGAVAIRPEQKR